MSQETFEDLVPLRRQQSAWNDEDEDGTSNTPVPAGFEQQGLWFPSTIRRGSSANWR